MAKDDAMVLCPICGEEVKKKGIGTHKRRAHGITKKKQKDFFDEVLSSVGLLFETKKEKGK